MCCERKKSTTFWPIWIWEFVFTILNNLVHLILICFKPWCTWTHYLSSWRIYGTLPVNLLTFINHMKAFTFSWPGQSKCAKYPTTTSAFIWQKTSTWAYVNWWNYAPYVNMHITDLELVLELKTRAPWLLWNTAQHPSHRVLFMKVLPLD